MSLHPQEIPPVPEETRRVARAVFPRGNIYMRMREELGAIHDDHLCAPLFPARGQPAATPWPLALTTVMPCAEGLSDRQAADAVRSRIDWKYALSPELTDPGFVHTVLNEFRTQLVAGQSEQLLLEVLLTRVGEHGLLHDLAPRDLLPRIHLLDGVYVDAELLVTAQTRHQVEVVGPTFGSYSRQRLEGQGYDLSAFVLDCGANRPAVPRGRPVSSGPRAGMSPVIPSCTSALTR